MSPCLPLATGDECGVRVQDRLNDRVVFPLMCSGFLFAFILSQNQLGPVCFVGIEFHFDNYNLDKTN
jgi:hypothetical protein